MSSEAEAELGALFITAKELMPIRQTLIEVGWPHPLVPIQTYNSMAAGVVNDTITARKPKSMDLRLHWLRCRESQQQFIFYWAHGSNNWDDYSTKHNPPIYHKSKHPLFVGAAQQLHQTLLAQC